MRHCRQPMYPVFPICLTRHARERQQQRRISDRDVRVALLWGHPYHQGSKRVAYYIGSREVQKARREGVDLSAFEGIAVVESHHFHIVTVIRCSSPSKLRKICHKERSHFTVTHPAKSSRLHRKAA